MDLIEKHFMERISTHLWVLEDYQMNPLKYTDDDDKPIPTNILACRNTLKEAKTFMKMLNRYQRLKYK